MNARTLAQRWARAKPRMVLMLLGGALVVGLLATTGYAAWVLRTREIADWRAHLDALSLVLSESTAQTMASSYQVLDSMVLKVQAQPRGNPAALTAALRERAVFETLRDTIGGLPQVEVASLVGADGTVLNFTRSYPAPVINLAERDYFRYHLEKSGNAPFLSAPVRNKGNGKWTFYLSRRLEYSDGSFAGVALIGVSCDFMSSFYKSVSLNDHAAVTLYRRDFTMLARWPQAEQLMGQRVLSGTTYAVITEGKSHDVVLTRSPRAADAHREVLRMGAVRLVRDYPLIINVTITEEQLLANWYSVLRLLGAVSLAGLLALLLAFWVVVALLRRREQDAQLALSLEAQANAASEAKSRFLAMMSHEIRTPMSAIAGMTELLLEAPLAPHLRNYAANVHRGVSELMVIINDVLDFSKVESGHMALELQDFDPAALVSQVVTLHCGEAERKGLRLQVNVGDGPGSVRGDPVRLRQVLGNLLSNAIKFTAAGEVAISYRTWADSAQLGEWRLEFAVQDSGIGIDAAAQQRLFEPFSQVGEQIHAKYGGTGLGLAICKRLVQLMGGQISCTSAAGTGSRFVFDIPCRLAQIVPLAAANTPGVASSPATTGVSALASTAAAVGAPPVASVPAAVSAPAAVNGTAATAMPAATSLTAAPAPPAATLEAQPQAPSDALPANGPRVLIAEDTDMNRQLARILMTRFGWVVEEAVNGQLALEALARQHYDLVLMDCMMPVMNGYDACRQLRLDEQAAGRPRVPVIALTASAIEGDRQRCLEAGMDDYLSKPFTAAQLEVMVTRWRPAPVDASS